MTYSLDQFFRGSYIDGVLVGVANVPIRALFDVVERLAGEVVARTDLNLC